MDISNLKSDLEKRRKRMEDDTKLYLGVTNLQRFKKWVAALIDRVKKEALPLREG